MPKLLKSQTEGILDANASVSCSTAVDLTGKLCSDKETSPLKSSSNKIICTVASLPDTQISNNTCNVPENGSIKASLYSYVSNSKDSSSGSVTCKCVDGVIQSLSNMEKKKTSYMLESSKSTNEFKVCLQNSLDNSVFESNYQNLEVGNSRLLSPLKSPTRKAENMSPLKSFEIERKTTIAKPCNDSILLGENTADPNSEILENLTSEANFASKHLIRIKKSSKSNTYKIVEQRTVKATDTYSDEEIAAKCKEGSNEKGKTSPIRKIKLDISTSDQSTFSKKVQNKKVVSISKKNKKTELNICSLQSSADSFEEKSKICKTTEQRTVKTTETCSDQQVSAKYKEGSNEKSKTSPIKKIKLDISTPDQTTFSKKTHIELPLISENAHKKKELNTCQLQSSKDLPEKETRTLEAVKQRNIKATETYSDQQVSVKYKERNNEKGKTSPIKKIKLDRLKSDQTTVLKKAQNDKVLPLISENEYEKQESRVCQFQSSEDLLERKSTYCEAVERRTVKITETCSNQIVSVNCKERSSKIFSPVKKVKFVRSPSDQTTSKKVRNKKVLSLMSKRKEHKKTQYACQLQSFKDSSAKKCFLEALELKASKIENNVKNSVEDGIKFNDNVPAVSEKIGQVLNDVPRKKSQVSKLKRSDLKIPSNISNKKFSVIYVQSKQDSSKNCGHSSLSNQNESYTNDQNATSPPNVNILNNKNAITGTVTKNGKPILKSGKKTIDLNKDLQNVFHSEIHQSNLTHSQSDMSCDIENENKEEKLFHTSPDSYETLLIMNDDLDFEPYQIDMHVQNPFVTKSEIRAVSNDNFHAPQEDDPPSEDDSDDSDHGYNFKRSWKSLELSPESCNIKNTSENSCNVHKDALVMQQEQLMRCETAVQSSSDNNISASSHLSIIPEKPYNISLQQAITNAANSVSPKMDKTSIGTSKVSPGYFLHVKDVVNKIRYHCDKKLISEAFEIAQTYIHISRSHDVNKCIIQELFSSLFQFIDNNSKNIDNSVVNLFDQILKLIDDYNIYDKEITSHFIIKCYSYPELNIYSQKLFLSCQKRQISLNSEAINIFGSFLQSREISLPDLLDFLVYVKSVCCENISKELTNLAFKKCKAYEFSDAYRMCLLLHRITSAEVDTFHLQEFLQLCFQNEMWTCIAKLFLEWDVKSVQSACIYNVLTANCETMSKYFEKFADALHGQEIKLSPQHKNLFGVIGTALMIGAYSKCELQSALEVLAILHKYNVNYFELQLQGCNLYLSQNVKSSVDYNDMMAFPFFIVFIAIEICLHFKRPNDAFTIFRGFAWVTPDENLDEIVKSYVISERFKHLLQLVSLLNVDDSLNEGWEALKVLISTIEQDVTAEDLQWKIKDLQTIYNEYLISLLNSGKVSHVKDLYQQSLGPCKDIFIVYSEVLRSLIATFTENFNDETNSVFMHEMTERLYSVVKTCPTNVASVSNFIETNKKRFSYGKKESTERVSPTLSNQKNSDYKKDLTKQSSIFQLQSPHIEFQKCSESAKGILCEWIEERKANTPKSSVFAHKRNSFSKLCQNPSDNLKSPFSRLPKNEIRSYGHKQFSHLSNVKDNQINVPFIINNAFNKTSNSDRHEIRENLIFLLNCPDVNKRKKKRIKKKLFKLSPLSNSKSAPTSNLTNCTVKKVTTLKSGGTNAANCKYNESKKFKNFTVRTVSNSASQLTTEDKPRTSHTVSEIPNISVDTISSSVPQPTHENKPETSQAHKNVSSKTLNNSNKDSSIKVSVTQHEATKTICVSPQSNSISPKSAMNISVAHKNFPGDQLKFKPVIKRNFISLNKGLISGVPKFTVPQDAHSFTNTNRTSPTIVKNVQRTNTNSVQQSTMMKEGSSALKILCTGISNDAELKKIIQFLKIKVTQKFKNLTPEKQHQRAVSLAQTFVKNNNVTKMDKKVMKSLTEFAIFNV